MTHRDAAVRARTLMSDTSSNAADAGRPSGTPAETDVTWYIGHRPKNDDEWALEVSLMSNAWWEERSARANFAIGHPPTSPQEEELEIRLRSIDRRWEVQLREQLARSELDHAAVQLNAQAERIRGFVVIGIVAVLIVAPLLAMLVGVAPADFGQFIAPVSGIAGTVVGYWFGRGGQSSSAGSPPSTTLDTARESDRGGPAPARPTLPRLPSD